MDDSSLQACCKELTIEVSLPEVNRRSNINSAVQYNAQLEIRLIICFARQRTLQFITGCGSRFAL
ncbi:hypothetical protein K438DRAFT_1820151, partial [Mycena galopus ATCC 62051]